VSHTATRLLQVMIVGTLASVNSADASISILRCGEQGLVHLGDTPNQVITECSQPNEASHRVEYRSVRLPISGHCKKHKRKQRSEAPCQRWVDSTIAVEIDRYTYDFGKHQFVYYLTFEDGRLRNITNGGYSQSK